MTFSSQSLKICGIRRVVQKRSFCNPLRLVSRKKEFPYQNSLLGGSHQKMGGIRRIAVTLGVLTCLALQDFACASLLNLGPEQIVQAGGTEITVPGYSVPSYVDWNNDGLKDLVVGDGPGADALGRVRVYLNAGTASSPVFSGFFYAQSSSGDLTVPAAGCLGAFPRVVDFGGGVGGNLLVGCADGTVKIFLNTNTDEAPPVFDAGTFLQIGPTGAKTNIDVGSRAAPTVVDWDNNGAKDLVIGAYDGKIHIFLNSGSDAAPDFTAETFASENGSALLVPPLTYGRSSPDILDLTGDGNKDLLTGNTEGKLLLYPNVGTNADPLFSGYYLIESGGIPIDLFGDPRSRPFVCDWTGDGYLDVLIGAGDGQIHLYQGVPEPATVLLLGFGCLLMRRKSKQ